MELHARRAATKCSIARLILVALLPVAVSCSDDAANAPALNTDGHPISRFMGQLRSSLRPELMGKHPRVYATVAELSQLRERAHGSHQKVWQYALDQVRAVRVPPPPPPSQERRSQNEVGLGIAEAALAYKIEGDPKYLVAAKQYLDAAASYDVWGYYNNKPNVDLAAGHLLYGMGWGYDLLYDDLTDAERTRYRDKLTLQARLLFDYYKPTPGKQYPYSQNHTFIPIAGLGVAAYALYDEVADAPEWAKLARAIYERVLQTYSQDGYYYEGHEYWVFSTPWLVHYLDAHLHATGEDLYDQPGFRRSHEYIAHSVLPDGQWVFDFGDIMDGPATRLKTGPEYERSHPGGRFHTNYNILYRLASRFRSGEAQGVAAWMESLNHFNAENYWSLFWYDPTVPVVPIEQQPRWHYFPDHDVVYWRSDWTPNAKAFAFKCGPPEGHHAKGQYEAFRDWVSSNGHAHPDANSFILYGGKAYLTGASGYAGIPLTAHNNTLLVDGKGQAREGNGHEAFEGVPNERLDGIRIEEVKIESGRAYVRGNAASAYEPELGLTKFIREFEISDSAPEEFVVTDDVAANHEAEFTALVHADEKVETTGTTGFLIKAPSAQLSITMPGAEPFKAAIVPNIVASPGPPGRIDQGPKEPRGERLEISSATKKAHVRLVTRLKIEARE
ncbi:DUF4962 domain-containing protein [Pendulispora rubella]|uniref:DUF4962 domain-containing protein n=1 Tax=Pendulispora rubella TaxID=2741070 RepID=A0ABZ2LEQ7_9BACT